MVAEHERVLCSVHDYVRAAGQELSTAQQPQDPAASSDLANACADLRMELARRDAEIESLQGALAAAAACQEEPPTALLAHEQSCADQVLANDQKI